MSGWLVRRNSSTMIPFSTLSPAVWASSTLGSMPTPATTLHVLDGDLEREQRVLELVRQAPRQLTPRRHAFGLHQALALRHQFVRHAIEGARQLPDLAGGRRPHGPPPAPAPPPRRPPREPLHRTRDVGRG